MLAQGAEENPMTRDPDEVPPHANTGVNRSPRKGLGFAKPRARRLTSLCS
jgi:hypothetical protein